MFEQVLMVHLLRAGQRYGNDYDGVFSVTEDLKERKKKVVILLEKQPGYTFCASTSLHAHCSLGWKQLLARRL